MELAHSASIVKRKSRLLFFLICAIGAICALFACAFVFRNFFLQKIYSSPSISTLSAKWKEYDYQGVYDMATILLSEDPFNNAALTYCGYSAFYLAVSSINSEQAQALIDEAIYALRLAANNAKKNTLPQIYYVLGKAYFYKNSIFSYYYYADLAAQYLNLAQKKGYKAKDIAEYLGISYAQLGMTMESISAFSEALLVRESDTLLLAIAEQYEKAGLRVAAKQYLFQVIQKSLDDSIVIKSRQLLGEILLEEKDFLGAKNEFEAVIEKNEDFAPAHYGLGLVYENLGDLAKARAQWRKTLRVQANHVGAMKKIQHYR